MIITILLILLTLLLAGPVEKSGPNGPWGYFRGASIGIVVLILLILQMTGNYH